MLSLSLSLSLSFYFVDLKGKNSLAATRQTQTFRGIQN